MASEEISILRVRTRREMGGHDVPQSKLITRFPRTQAAIRHAAPIADITAMFDNSRTPADAFSLARVQKKNKVLFDARDPRYDVDPELRKVAAVWLDKVA
ncbi:MAG TPA: hypothetical protein VMQ45_05365 [Burkholderiaceae bacterium]|nr:hypothetical protein [Burkholderiaceae bacterium]